MKKLIPILTSLILLLALTTPVYAYYMFKELPATVEIVPNPSELGIYDIYSGTEITHGWKYAITQRGTSHTTMVLLKNNSPVQLDFGVSATPISWGTVTLTPDMFSLAPSENATLTLVVSVNSDAPTMNGTFNLQFYIR